MARVYKKICKDKSVGVYMGGRDFVDHVTHVDPVDGVVLVDVEALKGRKAYVRISCTFKYGRDDEDVMGMAFRRELWLVTRQVYPPLQDKEQTSHTTMQQRLINKLGENAYGFWFELPDNLPCSVGLQPAPNDVGKHCCVEFEIKAFAAENPNEKVRKRSTVRLVIRKIQYAPEIEGPAPSLETTKNGVSLLASLEKQTYYHGETITVHVNVTNGSNKNIKNIIITVDQVATVVLYTNDSYAKCVAIEDNGDTIAPGESLEKDFTILPLLAYNTERRGIALDGQLKHEDTNLASSSVIKEGVEKEVLGLMVSYKLGVKVVAGGLMGMGASEVSVELPFRLMHPKPNTEKESEEEGEILFEDFQRNAVKGMNAAEDEDGDGNVSGGEDMAPKENEEEGEILFEDFQRNAVKGMNAAEDEDGDGNVSGGEDMAPKEK